jgi:REP element-mobilizing transposase RayT
VELVKRFNKRGYRVLCASVSKTHIHLLVELPLDEKETKKIVGLCKGAASYAVRDAMPGSIFSEGAKYELILDSEHHENVYDYILYREGTHAHTWSFKDAMLVFVPGRRRPARTITRAKRV